MPKFIIDIDNNDASKSMLEMILENELDCKVYVKEVESIDEDKLDKLANKYANEKWSNIWPHIPYESGSEEPDVIKDFKEGYRKAKEG